MVGRDKGEAQEWGHICIHTADSCGCTAETIANIVKQIVAVIQSLSPVQLFGIPWTTAHQATLSFTISQTWLKLMFIESMMPIQPFYPLLPVHIRWPKYWSFSFSISPSNEYSVLTSFQIDWFDLAVQDTLTSLF